MMVSSNMWKYFVAFSFLAAIVTFIHHVQLDYELFDLNHDDDDGEIPRYAYATLLTQEELYDDDDEIRSRNDAIFLSVRMLAFQLLHNHRISTGFLPYPLLVLVTDTVSQSQRDVLVMEGATIVPVERLDLAWISPQKLYLQDALTKLKILELDEYDKICYLAPTTMVTGPLSEIFEDPATQPQTTRKDIQSMQDDEQGLPSTYVMASLPAYPPDDDDPYFNPQSRKEKRREHKSFSESFGRKGKGRGKGMEKGKGISDEMREDMREEMRERLKHKTKEKGKDTQKSKPVDSEKSETPRKKKPKPKPGSTPSKQLSTFETDFFIVKPSKEVYEYYMSILEVPGRFDGTDHPETELLNYIHYRPPRRAAGSNSIDTSPPPAVKERPKKPHRRPKPDTKWSTPNSGHRSSGGGGSHESDSITSTTATDESPPSYMPWTTLAPEWYMHITSDDGYSHGVVAFPADKYLEKNGVEWDWKDLKSKSVQAGKDSGLWQVWNHVLWEMQGYYLGLADLKEGIRIWKSGRDKYEGEEDEEGDENAMVE